jgi:hypothetical protein
MERTFPVLLKAEKKIHEELTNAMNSHRFGFGFEKQIADVAAGALKRSGQPAVWSSGATY